MSHDKYRYGLLLPHFGQHATRGNLLEGAKAAEKLGFDSVWVRDHLIFHPHAMEGQSRIHVEPFVVLSAVAAVTERLILGTGSLIPYRHPIHAALALSSLDHLAPGRVIAGWGIGASDHEFDAIGLGGLRRGDMLIEQYDVMRKLWTGDEISYRGDFYSFDDVDIHPSPAHGSIPIWWCGDSPLSTRRAVELCDGWMPGRITLNTFRKRVERLEKLSREAGRERPTAAAIPIVSPGRTTEAGLAAVNWRGILDDARNSSWEPPDSGVWQRPEDLEGAVIAGTASDFAEVVHKYHEAGLEHLVFDLRFRFADWMECVQAIGEEVLPLLPHAPANTIQTGGTHA